MFFFACRCYLGKCKRSPFSVLPLTAFISAVVFYAFPLFYAMRGAGGEEALGAAAVVLSFAFSFVVLIILSLVSALIVKKFGRKI